MKKAKRVNAWVLTDAQLEEVAAWLRRTEGGALLHGEIRGTIGLLVKREKRRRAGRKKRGD